MTELVIISTGLNLALMVSLMILLKENITKHNNTYLRLVDKQNKELKKDIDLLTELIVDGQDTDKIIIEYFCNDYELLEQFDNLLKKRYKNYEKTITHKYVQKEIDRLIEQEKKFRKEEE